VLSRRPQRIQQALTALAVLAVGVGVGLVVIMIAGVIGGMAVSAITGNPLYVSGVFTGDFLATLVKGFFTAWYISAFYLLIAYAFALISARRP